MTRRIVARGGAGGGGRRGGQPQAGGEEDGAGETWDARFGSPTSPSAVLASERFDAALSAVGFGRYQFGLALIPCSMLAADAMIVALLSFVRRAAAVALAGTPAEAERGETLIPLFTFAGMLLGAPLAGAISDHLGRRIATMLTGAFIVGGLLTMAVATSLTIFFVGDLICGIGGGGLHVAQTLLAEFVPPESRDRVMAVYGTFWTTGVLVESLWFVYVDGGGGGGAIAWRSLAAWTAVPTLLAAGAAWMYLPESPRFLLANGRAAVADQVLLEMASSNGTLPATSAALAKHGERFSNYGSTTAGEPPTHTPLPELTDITTKGVVVGAAGIEPPHRPRGGRTASKALASLAKLLVVPSIRAVTLRLWVAWLVCTASYYAVVLAAPALVASRGGAGHADHSPPAQHHHEHGSSSHGRGTPTPAATAVAAGGGAMLVLQAAGEYPSYLLQYLVGQTLGRRWGLAFCSVVIGICGAAWAYGHAVDSPHELLLLMLFRMTVMVMFNLLWLLTPEAFPTTLRSTGCGACSCVSRLAGIAAPFILQLTQPQVMALAAAAYVMTFAAALTLPRETVNTPLPDRAEEDEEEAQHQQADGCPLFPQKNTSTTPPTAP